MIKFIFQYKSVYGVDRFYPVNDPARGLVCGLLKAKTLTEEQIELLRGIGLTVVVETKNFNE